MTHLIEEKTIVFLFEKRQERSLGASARQGSRGGSPRPRRDPIRPRRAYGQPWRRSHDV